jgi:hypothetical protein
MAGCNKACFELEMTDMEVSMEKKFSEWLISEYRLVVRDMSETNLPWLWRLFNVSAFAVRGKYVYIRDLAKRSERSLCRTLVHEIRHIRRQRGRLGWFVFLFRYGTSQSFRAMEEVQAYTRSLEARVMYGIEASPTYYAKLIRDNYRVNEQQYLKARSVLIENYGKIKRGEIHIVRDLWNKFQGK